MPKDKKGHYGRKGHAGAYSAGKPKKRPKRKTRSGVMSKGLKKTKY